MAAMTRPALRHHRLRTTLLLWLGLGTACFAGAKPSFNGPDFSGTYECKGHDAHEGPYASTVTLQIVRDQSVGTSAAYTLKMEAPGYGTYLGHVAADDRSAAISFALTDPAPKDYGTGLARFSKTAAGKWQFNKYYYEPEYKGGNHGTESCVQK
jgi:hypothetical protein